MPPALFYQIYIKLQSITHVIIIIYLSLKYYMNKYFSRSVCVHSQLASSSVVSQIARGEFHWCVETLYELYHVQASELYEPLAAPLN